MTKSLNLLSANKNRCTVVFFYGYHTLPADYFIDGKIAKKTLPIGINCQSYLLKELVEMKGLFSIKKTPGIFFYTLTFSKKKVKIKSGWLCFIRH